MEKVARLFSVSRQELDAPYYAILKFRELASKCLNEKADRLSPAVGE